MLLLFRSPLLLSATAILAAAASLPLPGRDDTADRRCLNCHGQEHIATVSREERLSMVAAEPGEILPERADPRALLVTGAALGEGAHRDVECVACHPGAAKLPHPARLPPAACDSCHEEAAAQVRRSRHTQFALQRSEPRAPRCPDCHGTHDIRGRDDRRSRVYPLEVIRVCASCHREHTEREGPFASGRAAVESYLDSVHGRTLTRAGLVVGATCADCHGHHEILPSLDPRSRVHRDRIPETCGRCHVGIAESFAETVHAEAARRRDPSLRPPVCTDCHTAHRITRADTPAFLRDIVAECGSCHQDLYRTYRESYHGQVQQLRSPRAARCSDCHGTHNIRRPEHPESTLSAANRPATCARCHRELLELSAAARANFAAFEPHADFRNPRRSPVLYRLWRGFTLAAAGLFALWGLHSAAWFVRGARSRFRRHPPPPPAGPPRAVRRFSALQCWAHGAVMVSFLGLAVTGLPLKFSDRTWAARLAGLLGGVESAGTLHRFSAGVLAAGVLIHLAGLARRWLATCKISTRSGRFPPGTPGSFLPGRRDLRDFRAMLRWFAGRGPRPRFAHWAYWEKFDYFTAALVVVLAAASGLVLWFPESFALVLSGFWFNVASLVHGHVALVGAGFLFSVHLFNAHLRWGKFSRESAIFTGRVPEVTFREERGAEGEPPDTAGDPEALLGPPAPRWLEALGRALAAVSVAASLAVVALIVLAVLP